MDINAGENVPFPIKDVPTPSFLLNLETVKKNAATMLARCTQLGVKLRPHMKTAKTIEAAEIATNGSRRKMCVSTLAEADFFAQAGFDDILFAMLFTEEKLPRIKALVNKLESFHLAVDSLYCCDLLTRNAPPAGKHWSVFLLVDTGSGREGSLWDDPATVFLGKKLANSENIMFRGLYTHEGVAAYSARGVAPVGAVCNDTASRVLHVASRLRQDGVECSEVTLGATPTASLPGKELAGITEIHPGNYIFYDAQQHMIGSCAEEDIACRVAMRVIGHYPQRQQLLVDAGWSAVSLDGKLANGSYGFFQGYPNLRLTKMHQEYGFVEFDPDQHTCGDFPHGTLLFLYPFHSCNTAMCYRKYYVYDNDTVNAVWRPCSQW